MELISFLQALRFRDIQPQDVTFKLDLYHEVLNTVLPPAYAEMAMQIAPLAHVQRMSSFAIAAIIGVSLRQLPPEQVYLNIGVWHGFTLFAGMLLAPQARCIGVDNFSEFSPEGQASQAFYHGFQLLKRGEHQRFVEADYQLYFQQHTEPIGLYYYDGAHDYASQYRALELAHPFMVPGGIVLVDDTNLEAPRQATLDFLKATGGYQLLAELRTASNGHPTFWNGLMILQRNP